MDLDTSRQTKRLVYNVESIKLMNSTRIYMAVANISKSYEELAKELGRQKKFNNLPEPTPQEVERKYENILNSLNNMAKRNYRSQGEFIRDFRRLELPKQFNQTECVHLYNYALNMRNVHIYNQARTEYLKDAIQITKTDDGKTRKVVNGEALDNYFSLLANSKNFFAFDYKYDEEGYLRRTDSVPNPFMAPTTHYSYDLDGNRQKKSPKSSPLWDGLTVDKPEVMPRDISQDTKLREFARLDNSLYTYGPYCSTIGFLQGLDDHSAVYLRNRYLHYLMESRDIIESIDPEFLVLGGQEKLDQLITPESFRANIGGARGYYIRYGNKVQDTMLKEPKTALGRKLINKKISNQQRDLEVLEDIYEDAPEDQRESIEVDDQIKSTARGMQLKRLIKNLAITAAAGALLFNLTVGIADHVQVRNIPSNAPYTISEQAQQMLDNYRTSYNEAESQESKSFDETRDTIVTELVQQAIREAHPEWDIRGIDIIHRPATKEDPDQYCARVERGREDSKYLTETEFYVLSGLLDDAMRWGPEDLDKLENLARADSRTKWGFVENKIIVEAPNLDENER